MTELEETLNEEDRWIPENLFMKRDLIPVVGIATSGFRAGQEFVSYMGNAFDEISKTLFSNEDYQTEYNAFKGLVRGTLRNVNWAGITCYNLLLYGFTNYLTG